MIRTNEDRCYYMERVDELGTIEAEIAVLAARQEEIKDELKDTGEEEISGSLFRAVIFDRKGAKKVNWKKIATDLGASTQRINANTKIGKASTCVKVTGRNAEAA